MVSWKLAAEMKLSDWTAALVIPRSWVLAEAGLGRIHSAFFEPACSTRRFSCVEVVAGDDVALAEVGLAGVLDLHAVHQVHVGVAELELVDDRAGQEAGVADGVDADLAEHLGDDDLQVLVVDLDPLRPVDVLDLALEVALDGFLARDPEDVVRDQRPFDQGVAGADPGAAVDPEVLAVGDEVLALDPALVLDDDRPLAAALLFEQLDAAVDLGDDGGLLGAPGLEQLGDRGRPPVMSWVPPTSRGVLASRVPAVIIAPRRSRCPPLRGCSCRPGCGLRCPR